MVTLLIAQMGSGNLSAGGAFGKLPRNLTEPSAAAEPWAGPGLFCLEPADPDRASGKWAQHDCGFVAMSEYADARPWCPARAGAQASSTSGVTRTITLPRCCRAWPYSRQFENSVPGLRIFVTARFIVLVRHAGSRQRGYLHTCPSRQPKTDLCTRAAT
jgi:hypothetical protein